MTPRAYLDNQSLCYYLVYLDDNGGSVATTRKGNISKRCKELVAQYSHLEHGLWDASEDMGSSMMAVEKNIRRAITQRIKERHERMSTFMEELHRQQEEQERIEAEELAQRKSVAGTKETLLIKPYDIMQHIEIAEQQLGQMMPGVYYVCINYKRKGYVELKRKARNSDHCKVITTVEREDKKSKASLHRFAVAVRKAYEDGSEMIGRTHAIKNFGQRLVDSIPHVLERKNNYFSSAAPRRLYDKQTLLYLKVVEIEQND